MELLTIQDSFEEVINDVNSGTLEQDKFWLARRNIELDENQDFWYINVKKLGMKDETSTVSFQPVIDNKFKAKVTNKTYDLQSFYRKINLARDKVSSVAIASNSEHLAVGTKDGDLIIYNLQTSTITHNIKEAHFENITILKFFPSDKVIMSVGIDLKIKIWGVNGELVRTMAQQVKQITSIGLLGKTGRNFISGSKDGSIDIWECGTGEVVYSFNRIQKPDDPVNCLVIGNHNSVGSKSSDLEFETANQCVYVGYESGMIQQFNIGDHCQTRVKLEDGDAGVSSIDRSGDLLVSGYYDGKLIIWDIISEKPIFKHQLNSHYPIAKLIVLRQQGDIISVLVYNGPETLLKLEMDVKCMSVNTTYLVGMEENFKIHAAAANKRDIVVGGDELAIYR